MSISPIRVPTRPNPAQLWRSDEIPLIRVLTSICRSLLRFSSTKIVITLNFYRLQPVRSLPQTPGVGQSENTQKITKPNTQTSCYRSWAASTSCEHNGPLMKNPAKTRQPGRLTHYHRYAIPQSQSRQRLFLQLIFQRTVNVKEYDSHKYKQPASLFTWQVGNIVIVYGVNTSEGRNTRMKRTPPPLPLRNSSWR